MVPKIATLEGKPHLVCPCVMGVPGVWKGSQGPLHYSADELAKSVKYFDGKPICVFHPSLSDGGKAGSPTVFTRQRVGTVFSTRCQNGKLCCQCWIDPQRLAEVDPLLLDRIKRGEIIEVSTGVWTDNEMTPGSFKGTPFIGSATKLVADHLALLSAGQVGACSVAMGAGLNRPINNASQPAQIQQARPQPLWRPRPLLSPQMSFA